MLWVLRARMVRRKSNACCHCICSFDKSHSVYLTSLGFSVYCNFECAAPFYLKFLAGAITGGVGSVIGNPFDVMKTLAQANQGKAVPLATLMGDMYKKQGMAGFYRGLQANIMRACVLNATKMGCYDGTHRCSLEMYIVCTRTIMTFREKVRVVSQLSDKNLFTSLFKTQWPKGLSVKRRAGSARMSVRPFVRPSLPVSS